jgi:hypothetical protein
MQRTIMSDEQQQYWYNVSPNGGDFGYNDQGIIPNELLDNVSLTQFGEARSLLIMNYSIPIGIQGGAWQITLAFKTAIDFTKPLPLDQFSAADSSIENMPAPPNRGQPLRCRR